MPDLFSIPSLIAWPDLVTLRGGQRKALEVVILTTFWSFWNFRNVIVFGTVILGKLILIDDDVDRVFF